jgi:hypothetical protein
VNDFECGFEEMEPFYLKTLLIFVLILAIVQAGKKVCFCELLFGFKLRKLEGANVYFVLSILGGVLSLNRFLG